jgi:phage-related protein (TIGR01555 family)
MSDIKQAADGLVNVASGLGTERAKRSHNTFQYSLLNNWQQLDAAYQTNWLARQIVDVPAEDMTREWRTIKCEAADDIRAEEDRLQVPMMVNNATTWARLYGGGGILMITGQDLSKPLKVNRIKKGGLQRLIAFDRYDLNAFTINTWDVLAENYLQPEFYTINSGAQQIHWTHIARFNGARLPRRQMAQTQGWGDSELRKCLDDIMDIVAAKEGIAELMQEANVDVLTRQGLADELASDQDEAITNRYALFGQMKSIVRLSLLDGDEKLERMTLNLSGVAPVLETFMTWISGAADIPVTRLFGTSAKGMNATGEGDLTNYYNSIRAKQLTQIDPGMRTLDEVLVRSALGTFPTDYNYVWNPLAQMNELQAAQARKANADTDIAYLDAGVIQVSQVQRNLQASESYQFDDEKIEELESNEDAGMFNEPVEEPQEPNL